MRASVLVVRAFDGSRRKVISEVDLPIYVGPYQFTIYFQIMNINPTYSFLLGSPWINAAGDVTSTLHQKLKFMFEDKLVIICGEEDLLVSELSSFRYVEEEEGIVEVPIHCLEFKDVISTTSNQDQSTSMVLSSVRSFRETLEKGCLSGWAQIVNVAQKHDRLGLGYHPYIRFKEAKEVQSCQIQQYRLSE